MTAARIWGTELGLALATSSTPFASATGVGEANAEMARVARIEKTAKERIVKVVLVE